MKKLIIVIVVLLISITSFGQQGINYKALIKDNLGNVVAGQNIILRFTIFREEENLSYAVYAEEHSIITDNNGIAIVNIGEGTADPDNLFSHIAWSAEHFLEVMVDIGSGFENLGLTEFKSVPYALNVTGLEKLDESSGSGWRLKGKNPDNYANIGWNAVDLSHATASSSTGGAAGRNSVSMGYGTRASGDYSTAMGYRTSAESYASIAIGRFNIGGFTDNSGTDNDGDTKWISGDPLFEIGNGNLIGHNALTVLKNGKTGINTWDPQSLFEVVHQNGGPTSSNLTNAISIKNLDSDKSWQFHVNSLGALVLYRNGIYTSYFHETSGAYVTVSDKRLKKDIIALENGTLNKVMQLNPVSYLMKDQTDTKRNLGLISQEVQELFPSITHYVKDSDVLSLSYTELIPVLIKALQEQQTIIDSQNAKINDQKSTLDSFENDLSIILKRLENLEIANN